MLNIIYLVLQHNNYLKGIGKCLINQVKMKSESKKGIAERLKLVMIELLAMESAMLNFEGVYWHYTQLTGLDFSYFPKDIFSLAKGRVTDSVKAVVNILSCNADNTYARWVLASMALLSKEINGDKFRVAITQKENRALKTVIQAIDYVNNILTKSS